ncbi:MAG: FAD-binding protein, partial [Candidatus Aminicenantes bacterium]|nr:FAD-binding protein [Candidatus Aminicenantes bacterium]
MKGPAYNKIDGVVFRRLTEITGPKSVFNSSEMLDKYSRDETIGLSFPPEAVVLPTTLKEVQDIFRLANIENIPITPRGLGTGL